MAIAKLGPFRHDEGMPKRSSKSRMPDPNELAFVIARKLTGEAPADPAPEESGKNPAAVALGRLGGKKGGLARAKALSKKQRAAIAKKAAAARWNKSK